MLYGILKSATNTGLDTELQCVFSTPLKVRSNQPAYVQDSLNLKRRASSTGTQRWEIEANLMPEVGTPNYILHSVANGVSNIIFARMPQVPGLITTSAAVTLTAGVALGATSLTLSSAVVAGEFLQLTGDSKVYLVTVGGATPTVAPKIRKAFTVGTALILGAKVTLSCRYDTDTMTGITFTDGILSDPGSVRLIEAL